MADVIRMVRMYDAGGRRLRDRSQPNVNRLLELKLAVATKRRRGVVVEAMFVSREDKYTHPMRVRHTRSYAYRQLIGEEHRLWQHKALPSRAAVAGGYEMSQAEWDAAMESIFRAVLISVLVSPTDGRPKSSKVVSIDSFQAKKKRSARDTQRPDSNELPLAA